MSLPAQPSVRSTLRDYHLVALYFEGTGPEPEHYLRGTAQLYVYLVHAAVKLGLEGLLRRSSCRAAPETRLRQARYEFAKVI